MNVVEALAYFKAGLIQAGYKEHQVLTAQEMNQPANTDSVPSASVHCLQTRLRRERRRVRISANQMKPPDPTALRGVRETVMGGLTWFDVLVSQPDMASMQNMLGQFLAYLTRTPLIDAAGNSYTLFTEGSEREKELEITWNDHQLDGAVEATFMVAVPGMVWADHPILPVDIHVQYAMERSHDE